jgi:hypothetical protein
MGIETILSGIGAIIMALNQALSDAPYIKKRWPGVKFPGWASYVPFVFWLVAAAIHFLPVTKPDSNSLMRASVQIDGIPIDRIRQVIEGATTAESEILQKPFKGRHVFVKGLVNDVTEDPGFALISLAGTYRELSVTLMALPSEKTVRLTKGQSVSADCEFSGMSDFGINLNRCHLR